MNMKAYRLFQEKIVNEYESMVSPENFTVIDGTLDIEEQQDIARKQVLNILISKGMISN